MMMSGLMMRNRFIGLLLLWTSSMLAAVTAVESSSKHRSSSDKMPSEEDFRVKGLDKIEPAFAKFDGSMFAGLLPIDDAYLHGESGDLEHGNLMFWMFEPRKPTVTDSLVIWFNGGPGCSSIDAGMLFEMGPVTTPLHRAGYFDPTDSITAPLEHNKYAWTEATTILYVEQPVGVGFSYGSISEPQNEDEVAYDFYNFMQHLYKVFPRHASKRLYLVGESYAGMYVPSMAHFMYLQNEQLKDKKHSSKKDDDKDGAVSINLGGIGLGNGWIDAVTQTPAVIEYAYWHGMIDSVARDAFRAEWEHCKHKYAEGEPEPFHPFTVPDECGIMPALLQAAGAGLLPPARPNEYDVTTWDAYLVLTDDDSTFARFYNNPKVREALNIPDNDTKRWHGCMPGEGRRLKEQQQRRLFEESLTSSLRHLKTHHSTRDHKGHDDDDKYSDNNNDQDTTSNNQEEGKLLDNDEPVSMAPYLTDLLDKAGIDVLVYNGDRDLSTCAQGSEAVLDAMDHWSGHEAWLDPNQYHRGLWMVDGEVAGYAKSVQNLQFVIVYNSGHMVPYNQPVRALDLITRLVQKDPADYVDKTIPVVYQVDDKTKKQMLSQEQEDEDGYHHSFNWRVGISGFVLGICSSILVYYVAVYRERKHDYETIG